METPGPYEINVGDELSIESGTELTLKRTVIVLPDRTITLPFLSRVRAPRIRPCRISGAKLEELYEKYQKSPAITLTPIKVDTKLEDLRHIQLADAPASAARCELRTRHYARRHDSAASRWFGAGPKVWFRRIQGRARARNFAEKMEGIEVNAGAHTCADARYVYVLGESEVARPLLGPKER